MLNILANAVQFFTDQEGHPLNGGHVFIGVANTNPVSNQVTAYLDAGLTLPVPQPLRTSGGVITWNGSPRTIYLGVASYSLLVLDRRGRIVQSVPEVVNPLLVNGAANIEFDGTTLDQQFLSRVNRVVDSIADLRSLSHLTYTRAFVTGYYAPHDGGGGAYQYDPSDATSVDNGGTLIVAYDGGRWKLDITGGITANTFGAKGDGATDSTAAIRSAHVYLKSVGGGVLGFQTGDYAFNLDVSGNNPEMKWVGIGSVTMRPFLYSPALDYVLFANNTSGTLGSGSTANITFENLNFTGRAKGDTDGAGQYGRVGSAVEFLSAWGRFVNCSFEYGINNGFYSKYGQYNEFYWCTFGACVAGAASTGCSLDSNGSQEAANENIFVRCKFLSNKNGLQILGGLGNRLYGCTFQDTQAGGKGALILDADSTGFGAQQNLFSSCYFEANSLDVAIGIAPGQTFEACTFLAASIVASSTYDLRFMGCTTYNAAVQAAFSMPSGNNDPASLTWIGNNFEPNVAGIAHTGPTYLNIQGGATRNWRNDNQLITTGQIDGNAAVPLLAAHQYGFRSPIARTASAAIFSISQSAFVNAFARFSSFELILNAVNDDSTASQFGYAARLDRFHVFITNNTSGTPTCLISHIDGVDTGINTAFTAIGQLALTSFVSGDNITFSVSWSGAGSSPSALASALVGYEIRYMGGNPVRFERG